MKTEIEAKFLHVNPDEIRARLEAIGAVCKQPMRLMRRVTFDNELMDERHAFLRIRDEGYRIAMTYKQFDEMSLTGAKEIELTVNSYDDALALAAAIGLKQNSVQEARREIWELDDAEVVIDEWPWIDPFIEVEAPSEASVKNAAQKLGFAWKDARFGDVMTAYYAQYPLTGDAPQDMVYNLPAVRFEDSAPSILRT